MKIIFAILCISTFTSCTCAETRSTPQDEKREALAEFRSHRFDRER
jgi:hypothetical protein